MTVDYFLLEGERAVPGEFAEMRRLQALSHAAFFECVDDDMKDMPQEDRLRRETECALLKRAADAAEEAARTAFLLWLMRGK